MIKAVFFDLDGTLLPLNEDAQSDKHNNWKQCKKHRR